MDKGLLRKLVDLHDALGHANLHFGELIYELPEADRHEWMLTIDEYAAVIRELDRIIGGCPNDAGTPGFEARLAETAD